MSPARILFAAPFLGGIAPAGMDAIRTIIALAEGLEKADMALCDVVVNHSGRLRKLNSLIKRHLSHLIEA